MPKSSSPAIVVVNALLIPLGFAVLIGGIGGAVVYREIWWAFALLAGGGVLMLAGAAQGVSHWRRAVQVEDETHHAMLAAVRVRPHVSSGLPAPVLAHWTYDPAEWRAYAHAELRYRTREALTMTAATVAVGTPVLGLLEGEWKLAFVVSAVIGTLIGVGRWLVARAAYGRNRAVSHGDVVLGRDAMLVNGRYEVVHDNRIHFGGARVLEGGCPAILEIRIMVPGKYRRMAEEYRIPIPAGREEEARAVARELAEARG